MKSGVVCVVDVRNGRWELERAVRRDAKGARWPIERWKCPHGVRRGSSRGWVVRMSWADELSGVGKSWRLLSRGVAGRRLLLLLPGSVVLSLRIRGPWCVLLGRLALAAWCRRVLVERGAEALG